MRGPSAVRIPVCFIRCAIAKAEYQRVAVMLDLSLRIVGYLRSSGEKNHEVCGCSAAPFYLPLSARLRGASSYVSVVHMEQRPSP